MNILLRKVKGSTFELTLEVLLKKQMTEGVSSEPRPAGCFLGSPQRPDKPYRDSQSASFGQPPPRPGTHLLPPVRGAQEASVAPPQGLAQLPVLPHPHLQRQRRYPGPRSSSPGPLRAARTHLRELPEALRPGGLLEGVPRVGLDGRAVPVPVHLRAAGGQRKPRSPSPSPLPSSPHLTPLPPLTSVTKRRLRGRAGCRHSASSSRSSSSAAPPLHPQHPLQQPRSASAAIAPPPSSFFPPPGPARRCLRLPPALRARGLPGARLRRRPAGPVAALRRRAGPCAPHSGRVR